MENLITEHFVIVNNKKYTYVLKKVGTKKTFMECKDANIAQEFLNEDIPALLIDLPNLILEGKKYKDVHNQMIRFRISPEDKKIIMKKAHGKGYKNISSFLRDLALKN